jgi:tetratricopeptide (TPR) repeat protein
VPEASFADLRALAAWFSSGVPRLPSLRIDRILTRLRATALPLLGRELAGGDPARRDAAREALARLAGLGDEPALRARVVGQLHAVARGGSDEAKVVAHGLLCDLGERAALQLADPTAIRARSVVALAGHLQTDADVAGAADLMIQQLPADELVELIDALARVSAEAAARLAAELGQRLDLPVQLRDRIAVAVAPAGPAPRFASPDAREPAVAVLVDAAARLVVVACAARGRRHRRWSVLIGAPGRIDDCLHEDDTAEDGAPLVAALCAEGYRVASRDPERAAELVAAAARRTAESSHALHAHYYLGRDLLGLGDLHLGDRRATTSAALARAIELVAAGDHAAALPLLERCDPDHPEAAAALAAVRLARGEPLAAIAPLERALAAEPDWPLHHWNLATALHQLGDARGCYHALRRFVATSAAPSGLYADPDQPARVGRAERMMAELERTARLTGRSLRRRARPSARPARPRPKARDGATS